MKPNTQLIRSQNDQFRQNIPTSSNVPGRIMITKGVQDLVSSESEPNRDLASLLKVIRTYDAFNNNDPHREHDFGSFPFKGQKLFWKIDYYAKDMMHGTQNPADLEITMRVLTVMLALEY
ncbi:MAG: DUF3768 domain-containing protein [Pseudomonadota bacterium]